MNNCIFCKIINREILAKIIFENDLILAFEDIAPQAPVHILLIPKKHIRSIHYLNKEHSIYLNEIFHTIKEISKKYNIEDNYRIVSNHGTKAGQSVFHLHFHLLGGRDMNWPPG